MTSLPRPHDQPSSRTLLTHSFALVLCLAAGVHAAPAQDGGSALVARPATDTQAATHSPTADQIDDYREHVITLANPFFEGRGTGTRGNRLAADYIEHAFRKAGLLPIFPLTTKVADGSDVVTPGASYRQEFSVGRDPVVTSSGVTVRSRGLGGMGGLGGIDRTLTQDTDFAVLGVSGSGSVSGEVVFAGYAIKETTNADGVAFTSFDDDDLKGKIVMVMRFEPMDEKGTSVLSGTGGWSNAAALYPKLRESAERGAAAVILVNPPGADDPRVGKLETTQGTARLGRALEIPVIMLSQAAADALVRAGDARRRSLEELRRVADAGAAAGKEGVVALPDAEIDINVQVEQRPRLTENVAGVLPGRGNLKDQYIIVGAHFDHIGDGSSGGSRTNQVGLVHPGADDNASGTSGLLVSVGMIKQLLAELPEDAPVRSVIFMGFSGEEIGLLGSRHFVRNSPFNAESMYAMLNLDMIGRLRETLEITGTGTAEGLESFIQPALERSGMKLSIKPGGRGPSDHASFYAADIPVLFFFTGLHPEYHAPTDVSELINFEGGTRVAMLVSDIVAMLAARSEPLTFTSTDRRQGGDENRPDQQASPGMGSLKIRFGIAPGSYAEEASGVPVGEVFPNTSAADAGIKVGDRLIKWNDEKIEDVPGWMRLMSKHEPGDEVNVTIVRDKQDIVLKVKLKARDRGDR